MSGDTLAERYERTMSRLERITQAGYQVKIQWECEFDETGIVNQKPELLTHPIVEQFPLNPRCFIRGSNRSHAFVPLHLQIFQVPNRPSDHSRR